MGGEFFIHIGFCRIRMDSQTKTNQAKSKTGRVGTKTTPVTDESTFFVQFSGSHTKLYA